MEIAWVKVNSKNMEADRNNVSGTIRIEIISQNIRVGPEFQYMYNIGTKIHYLYK